MRIQNNSTKALRELLLLKSDNLDVQLFLRSTTDSALADMVTESLIKMASLSGKRAVKMNSAVRDMLNTAVADKSADEPTELEGLRGALGHHASHYAAARAAGNQDLAEEHAQQFTKLGHLASKLDSAGKTIAHFEPDHPADYRASMADIAQFDAPDLQAWQATSPQHFADANKSSGVDITGWRAHDKQTGVRKKDKGDGAPTKKSFAWYANDPHPNHRDTPGHTARGNDRGYPFEQVKVNGKHIPVGLVESSGQYEVHPFDSHPIVSHFDDSPEEHAAMADAYKNKLSAFHAGEKGLQLATKNRELASPESGKQPGMIVHPKVPKGGE
jgi:hypothetical protein